MVLVAFGFVGKLLTLPGWGRVAERLGPVRLLWFGGVGIVPVSALWLVSQSFWYLAFVQVLGGALWAAYELAMVLLFFEAIPRRQRTSLLTMYNLANSAAMVVGGLLGAAYLGWFGGGRMAFLALFGLSSVARAATLGLLVRVPLGEREAAATATRTIAVRSTTGTIEQPILAAMREGDAPGPVQA
jgi:MFS family permease